MIKNSSNEKYSDSLKYMLAEESRILLHKISNLANQNIQKIDFLKRILKMLINFSGSDEIELWLLDNEKQNSYERIKHTQDSFYFEIIYSKENSYFEKLFDSVMTGQIDPSLPFISKKGSLCIGDIDTFITLYNKNQSNQNNFKINTKYKSFFLIPLIIGDNRIGLLQLKSGKVNFFAKYTIELYENFTQTLGLLLMGQRAQAALHERVKELTCLYRIAHTVEVTDFSIKEIMQNIVELLPPAWQYPKIAHSRIILDGQSYLDTDFKEGPQKQTADIVVNSEKRGTIEVVYEKEKTKLDEGPFLKEERSLINNIAREIAIIIERKQTFEYKEKLNKQLRHADRLATIGQLAAGIAHELNEPLCNILGFAQLSNKNLVLPKTVKKDIEKIINASLHAREIVKKLLIFARQMPTQKIRINLNNLIKEGIYFLESRCIKEGIELSCSFDKNLPMIIADPAQLTQVLVNLIVNAIQSMPGGGSIKIQTLTNDESVLLIIQDTGKGMSEEIMKNIFLPFFTTKDVNQGTGLGLSVVHGIINSHSGSIKVDSKVGHGSRFEIKLPIN